MLRTVALVFLLSGIAGAAEPLRRIPFPKPPAPPEETNAELLALTPAGQALVLDGDDLAWVDPATGKDAARRAGAGRGALVADDAGAWLLRSGDRPGRHDLVDLEARKTVTTLFLPGLSVRALTVT